MSEPAFHAVSQFCARVGWPPPDVVASTGSTNADLVGATGDGLVRIALEQTAGRGRLGRDWVSAPGDGLTFSVRLEVPPTVSSWGWLPLMAGLAVARAAREAGARGTAVKWPNDVIAAGGKLAGVLSVRDGSAAIVGIGVNLRFRDARPDPAAVSVAELGGDPDPDRMLAVILQDLHDRWGRFVAAAGDADRCGLMADYCDQCVTLNQSVSVTGAGEVFNGYATGIDRAGHLLVRTEQGSVHTISAADVTLQA